MAASLTVYGLQGGRIANARIGIAGAEGRPRRIARGRSGMLTGNAPSTNVFTRGRRSGGSGSRVSIEDVQTSAEFRRILVNYRGQA